MIFLNGWFRFQGAYIMDFAEVMVFELLAVDGNENVLPGHKTFAVASHTR